MRRTSSLAVLVVVAWFVATSPCSLQAQNRPESPTTDRFSQAEALIDAGDGEAALEALAGVRGAEAQSGRFLQLRGTARPLVGDQEARRKGPPQAVKADPQLRPAWLLLAGLATSEKRWDDALEAFQRAEALAPGEADNSLNIGAVLLLKGDAAGAAQRFARYLQLDPSAQAHYLVATNYPVVGQAAGAAPYLRRAIDLDERTRVAARTDPAFLALAETPALRAILDAPPNPPGQDAYTLARSFDEESYSGPGCRLLSAVLSAVQTSGEPYDPRVEATAAYAVIWGQMRIVVRNDADGRGVVTLDAPADRMPLSSWRQRSEAFLREVQRWLVTQR